MHKDNIRNNLPSDFSEESYSHLMRTPNVRVERIVSKGHRSPETGWYDQDENEWVMVVEGEGKLQFENGDEVHLTKGDYVNIPANTKHKVTWTDPDVVTIWLAVFYP